MRRGIAFIVTLLFGWLLILPAVAASTDATLPACCRKNGKHHCSMNVGGTSHAPAIGTISGKCPCCPQSTAASVLPFAGPSVGNVVFGGVIQHPAVAPQTEASYRISYDRSRQKRGPPSSILS